MMTRANEIAEILNNSGEWDYNLCEELCNLANLSDEWSAADGETFENVVYKAAEILGVEI